MEMIYTLPFFIREEPEYYDYDLKMAEDCFTSLQQSEDTVIVMYNQGCLTNENLKDFLSAYRFKSVILGSGENIGIAQARQICFEYIWNNYCDVPFIAEIHLDMIFPVNWHHSLIDYLKSNNEPMISPGIVIEDGGLYPIDGDTKKVAVPQEQAKLFSLLKQLEKEEVREGFVHPVIHRSNVLKAVGGYDCRFFRGKQCFEDMSLILGYIYYMGLRVNWKPKAYLKSWVYHAAMVQRKTLVDRGQDFNLNLNGLFYQYGGYGFKQLSEIFKSDSTFETFFRDIVKNYEKV
ncbi:hypothetical protein [Petroclostridium sp. X23]|uniref:hypothetical protein n=1 Tax=Petroclostridium sp. X23 TaxID=3045146 RepID=UPI0024ADA13E|nr:hypothetical protein [Petroclostridium sp. X23]WHH58249.1 hypothetical protein QKW49_20985 [Petroclostridium sp. X23]